MTFMKRIMLKVDELTSSKRPYFEEQTSRQNSLNEESKRSKKYMYINFKLKNQETNIFTRETSLT